VVVINILILVRAFCSNENNEKVAGSGEKIVQNKTKRVHCKKKLKNDQTEL
jgi:hypothetical protein